MARKKSTDFQVSFEDEDPNAIYRGEMETLKIEKLSHRVTLLTILIPCLVGIIIFFGYLDIKDRLTKSSYTGTQGVEKLARDLDSRFSSLSLKQARLEESLAAQTKTLAALDKKVKGYAWRDKVAIKKVTETIGTMAEQKDLQALNETVTRIDKAVSPLALEISSGSIKLEALDTRTAGKLASLSKKTRMLNEALAQLKTETQAVETEMRALIADKVDAATLAAQVADKIDAATLTAQVADKVDVATLTKQVAKATKPINAKVNGLLRRVGLLQAEVSALTKAQSFKKAPPKKTTTIAPKKPTPKPALKKAIPKTKPITDNKIVEQVLEE